MSVIAFDTETYPFVRVGKATRLTVPKVVCLSWADDAGRTGLLDRADAVDLFVKWLDEGQALVGHYVNFGPLVMARAVTDHRPDYPIADKLFEHYAKGLVHDTMTLDQLNDIKAGGMFRRGGYDLKSLCKRHLGIEVTGKSGPDVWRVRYNELDGTPPNEWPVAAREYAINDSVYTLMLLHKLKPHANAAFQVCAGFSLALISAWGVMIDVPWAEKVDAFYAVREHKYADALREAGIMRGDGSVSDALKRALYADAWKALSVSPLLTNKGAIATNAQAKQQLEDLADQQGIELSDTFQALADYNRATKFRSTYLEPFLDADTFPLCARYSTLVSSGRTSSSGPNVQNIVANLTELEDQLLKTLYGGLEEPPTQYERVMEQGVIVGPDLRGCIVPREGKVLVSADYSAIELGGLAQVMKSWFGTLTPMGHAINEGKDLHIMVAQGLLDTSYEDIVERIKAGDSEAQKARRIAKIANYGFAGGASAKTFKSFARQAGMVLDDETCIKAHRAWHDTWTGMRRYFSTISSLQRGSMYWVEQLGPRGAVRGWRTRAVDKYTKAANTPFQGLVGDGAKMASWMLAKKCHVDKTSALYGTHVVLFIHDEFVVECDADVADDVGRELSKTMVEGMGIFLPDIRVEADYAIKTERWSK